MVFEYGDGGASGGEIEAEEGEEVGGEGGEVDGWYDKVLVQCGMDRVGYFRVDQVPSIIPFHAQLL